MIKFIKKKYMQENKDSHKIIIYYNNFDIFIGIVFLIIVSFFIRDYFYFSLRKPWNGYVQQRITPAMIQVMTQSMPINHNR